MNGNIMNMSFCPCKTISFPICQYICIYTISCFNPQTLMGFLSSFMQPKYKLISILIYIFSNQKHHSLFPNSAFLINTTSSINTYTDSTQKETQTVVIPSYALRIHQFANKYDLQILSFAISWVELNHKTHICRKIIFP